MILYMVTVGEKWYYLFVKSISRLLHGIKSNHNDDSYCMNCLHSFRTKNKFKLNDNVCKNHNYCNVITFKVHDIILSV